jgi:hypothetical protein
MDMVAADHATTITIVVGIVTGKFQGPVLSGERATGAPTVKQFKSWRQRWLICSKVA